MNVSELKATIDRLAEEIGCDGNGGFGAHKIPSSVDIYLDGDDGEYEIAEIEPQMLMGCGCWSGITIRIRKL